MRKIGLHSPKTSGRYTRMNNVRWHSLKEARTGLNILHASGKTIGSVHTLGALHEGHAKLINLAASENDFVVVSVYPNIAQLPPGSAYQFDIDKDSSTAFASGATHLIT